MEIYDDQSTQVYMQPFGTGYSFFQTEIKNIFDNSTLNISRSDDNYSRLNLRYRAPVFFNGCIQQSDRAWMHFVYHGQIAIYTHKSPIVYINVNEEYACWNSVMFAHESNPKLHILL